MASYDIKQRAARRAAGRSAQSVAQPAPQPQKRWRLLISVGITLVILALLMLNRRWLAEAARLALTADVRWLGAALLTILASYFVSAQVFQVVLRAFGHRFGALRLWATAITAIVISQSVPAGGVGSYAFLVNVFKRRKVATGQAAIVATSEALSYAGAMVVFGVWSIGYVLLRPLAAGSGATAMTGTLVAGGVALGCVAGAGFILTRPETTLRGWLARFAHSWARLRRRPANLERVHDSVAELVRGRAMLIQQRRRLLLLGLIQLVALSGHSFALWLVLLSLGVQTSFGVVTAAFGVALITSTFNVLPGGGGTVEAVVVAVLLQLGVGPAAVPAAILFRLLNFWLLLPIAAGGYFRLMRRPPGSYESGRS